MRAQSAAPHSTGFRFGNRLGVLPNAIGHKTVQISVGLSFSTGLEPMGVLGWHWKLTPSHRKVQLLDSNGLKLLPIRVVLRSRHVCKPTFPPPISVAPSSTYAIALMFVPGHPQLGQSVGHHQVPVIGVSQPRLHVTVHPLNLETLGQMIQDLNKFSMHRASQRTGSHRPRFRPRLKLFIHIRQALLHESNMATRGGCMRQISRLKTVQQQVWPVHLKGLGQWRMVSQAQVALEPNDAYGTPLTQL